MKGKDHSDLGSKVVMGQSGFVGQMKEGKHKGRPSHEI